MAVSDIRAFRDWCRLQTHRNDVVGDFARDFTRDDCASLVRTLSGLDRHLMDEHAASGAVLEARDAAWREYAARR